MRAVVVAVLLLAAVPLVGCLGSEDPPDDGGSEGPDAGTGNASGNGLAEPPDWEPGDWWQIRFHDPTPAADGATYTATRVVGGTANDSYRVGMPASGFSDELVIWHMPGFGEVGRQDLGYLVHGEYFQALDFPLEEGNTWTTNFQQELQAEVVDVESARATVNFTGGAPGGERTVIQLVYDGEVGHITELASFPGPVRGSAASHGTYEVVDHGFDYEGTVMVPENRREVFFRIRVAGATSGGSPEGPTGTAEVPDDVDRVTLGHVLGEIHGQGPTTGEYQITSTTPDGREIQDDLLPGSAPGRHVTYYGLWNASGTWSFEHVAAGTGATVAEGIGYGVRNVTLPR